jgi:tetratricopeptide (TPR) repeat protein
VVRRVLSLLLVVGLSLGATPSFAQATDPEVVKGIKQVEDGDYDGAILTLDNAARRLASDPNKFRDLSQAYLYLGISYAGKGHEAAAKAKFREALGQTKDLSLSPEKFPPKVINLFEAAKQERTQAPAPAAAKKGGSHKGLFIGLGVAAAAGVGIAAAAGGKGTPSGPALKTDMFGPIALSIEQYCQTPSFSIFVEAAGTLQATLTWQEAFATLQMALFDNAAAADTGSPILIGSNQTSNTSATFSFPVVPKQYLVGVCHVGTSCAGMSPCAATFTLNVRHP